jgi:HSP20 family protein
MLRCGVAFPKWDPLRDLLALHEQIGQLVGTDAPGWTPPVDLYETATDYVLVAELPGLSRDRIDVHAEGNRITIRGERAAGPGAGVACERYHRVERGHGPFSRAFTLSDAVDVERVTARFEDGILTVVVPKAADRGVRRLDIA